MSMIELPLFGLGLQGKSPNVSANKLVNAYYEFHNQDQDRTKVSIYGTPGLSVFIDQGANPWRGLHVLGDYIYGVNQQYFYQINNAGVVTNLGTLNSTTGRVDITDDGNYIVIVDGAEIYTYYISTDTFAVGSDAYRPTSPNTCCFDRGRILTDENGTGQFKGGGSYDPMTWSALDYATAESNPDDLVRVINYRGIIALFGQLTTEFWQNIGGSGFPYELINGAVIEFGLAARWSVAKFNGTYAFLAKNREGQVSVKVLNGYSDPITISNYELEYLINGYSDVADATAFGYRLGGHPMLQINFPTANKSWLYDASTNYWSEMRYGSNNRHRAELSVDFLNQRIVSDYSNGKLYYLDESVYQDNGDEIHTILRGRHIFLNKNKVTIRRLELGIEPGVGGFYESSSDLITNGTFTSSTTGWTAFNCTLSIVSAALRMTDTLGGVAYAYQAIACEIGQVYTVSIDLITDGVTGDAQFNIGTNINSQDIAVQTITSATPGTYTFDFTATATTHYFTMGITSSAVAAEYVDWDNVSIVKKGASSNAGDYSQNPVAGLRLSKDGGHTWGTQKYGLLGNRGEYLRRCIFRSLGAARDVVPEITITDNVKRVIIDATLITEAGTN